MLAAAAVRSMATIAAALVLAAPAAARFSVVPSPTKAGDVLNGVSASSATDAWAVGSFCCFHYNGYDSLTVHWAGTGWVVVPSFAFFREDDVLNAVADLAPTNVWAVGYVRPFAAQIPTPLIAHWSGGGWSASTRTGASGTLRAVSADSADDVWAVGDDGQGHALALRFDGVGWSPVAVPPAGASDVLLGVRAFSSSDVWAVGDQTAGTTAKTLVMHWNGSAWSVVSSPNPDPNSDILHAVTGASSNDVWAVGEQGTPGTHTLIAHWNGSGWSVAGSPNVANGDVLLGAAAVTGSSVAAVGIDGTPIRQTLAETWNGADWSLDPSADPGAGNNVLNGASAIPGIASVWAVGYSTGARGGGQPLIEKGP